MNDHMARLFRDMSDVGESMVSLSIIDGGSNIVGESKGDRTASGISMISELLTVSNFNVVSSETLD